MWLAVWLVHRSLRQPLNCHVECIRDCKPHLRSFKLRRFVSSQNMAPSVRERGGLRVALVVVWFLLRLVRAPNILAALHPSLHVLPLEIREIFVFGLRLAAKVGENDRSHPRPGKTNAENTIAGASFMHIVLYSFVRRVGAHGRDTDTLRGKRAGSSYCSVPAETEKAKQARRRSRKARAGSSVSLIQLTAVGRRGDTSPANREQPAW